MFIDEFDADNKMRIGDFADANEKWINMLRIGEKSGERSLEWFAGPDGARVEGTRNVGRCSFLSGWRQCSAAIP